MEKMPSKSLLNQKNYFHAVFQKGVTVTEKDGKKVVSVKGYASTVEKDRYGDVVLPSAFSKTLDTFMMNPVLLLQHKAEKPIGKVTKATIDEMGLYIEADITQDVDGCMSAIENDVLKGFSIGYAVSDYEWKEIAGADGMIDYVFVIKELELMEISVVSIPANRLTLMKSLQMVVTKEANPVIEEEEQANQDAIEAQATETPEEVEEQEVEETEEEDTPIAEKAIPNEEKKETEVEETPEESEPEEQEPESNEEQTPDNSQDGENEPETVQSGETPVSESVDEEKAIEARRIKARDEKAQEKLEKLEREFAQFKTDTIELLKSIVEAHNEGIETVEKLHSNMKSVYTSLKNMRTSKGYANVNQGGEKTKMAGLAEQIKKLA